MNADMRTELDTVDKNLNQYITDSKKRNEEFKASDFGLC